MTNDNTTTPTPPIVVNASPTADQISAGLQMLLMAVSAVAAALGFAKVAGGASSLMAVTGTVATLVAFVWAQFATHAAATKAAAMANALPDSVAKTK